MPTYTNYFNLYKPDIGQKNPEWGTPVNTNFDDIDRLLFYRSYMPLWGMAPPQNPSVYDDEFDDNFFDTTQWQVAGNANYNVTEDDFHRLLLRKTGWDDNITYFYQNFTAPVLNDQEYFTIQTCIINNNAAKAIADVKSEAGIYIADSIGNRQLAVLVWSNIFDNLVRVYSNTYHATTKGTENYNWNYGRLNQPLFLRFLVRWDSANALYYPMVQASWDGLHWRNLHLDSTGFSDIDVIGIIFADYNPGGDEPNVFSSIYHFRYNYQPDPLNFV